MQRKSVVGEITGDAFDAGRRVDRPVPLFVVLKQGLFQQFGAGLGQSGGGDRRDRQVAGQRCGQRAADGFELRQSPRLIGVLDIEVREGRGRR